MVLSMKQESGEGNSDIVAARAIGVAILFEVFIGSLVRQDLNKSKDNLSKSDSIDSAQVMNSFQRACVGDRGYLRCKPW